MCIYYFNTSLSRRRYTKSLFFVQNLKHIVKKHCIKYFNTTLKKSDYAFLRAINFIKIYPKKIALYNTFSF